MLLLESQPTSNAPAFAAASHFRLRIRAEGTSEQTMDLRQGKTTIGSSPRCDIRIGQPGVQPLHCLILLEGKNLSVRRWAAGTRLNGQPFDEAPLEPGDRISVGNVELELAAETTERPRSEGTAAYVAESPPSPPAASSLDSWDERNTSQVTELSEERQNDALQPAPNADSVATVRRAAWKDPQETRHDEAEQSKGRLTAIDEHLSQLEETLATWSYAREDWQHERAEWRADREQAQRQWSELERQIAELQFRASEIVGRIERLEHSMAEQALVPKFEPPRVDSPCAESPCAESPCAESPCAELESPCVESPPSERPNESFSDTPVSFEPTSSSFDSLGEPTEPEAEAAVDPQPDTEDELAPFAEFSIWRQGATGADSESDASDRAECPAEPSETSALQPSAEPAAPAAEDDLQVPPTKSFIETYGHMFEDDGANAEQSPGDGIADSDLIIRKPQIVGQIPPEGDVPPASEEEESIEQYMSKLMQRIRGDRPVASASPSASVQPRSPSAFLPGFMPRAAHPAPIAGAVSPASADAGESPRRGADGEWLTTSLGTVRRKAPIVEQPADLATLRAVANESARRAISTHGLRVHRRKATTKVIVSTLAGMTSLWMMLSAPHWQDLQFITACVSLIVAAYWAGQTYAELIDALRAAAYDGPEDQLQGVVNLPPAALPNAAENSAKS